MSKRVNIIAHIYGLQDATADLRTDAEGYDARVKPPSQRLLLESNSLIGTGIVILSNLTRPGEIPCPTRGYATTDRADYESRNPMSAQPIERAAPISEMVLTESTESTAPQWRAMGRRVMVPYKELLDAPENVRVKKASAEEVQELAGSIKSQGLINALSIYREAGEASRSLVYAGSTRRRALGLLVKSKFIDGDTLIPCDLGTKEEVIEASIAENEVRVAMHPADLVEGYRRLLATGRTVGDIAARFGKSAAFVERVCALGRLHKRILKAFRDDEISIEAARAYTFEQDRGAQLSAFRSMPKGASAQRIREVLTEGMSEQGSPLVRFVTLKAYEKAGGAVRRDLFSDKCYCVDFELLRTLAEQKIGRRIAKVEKEGWAWVDGGLDADPYGAAYGGGMVWPTREVPEALALRQEELREMISAIGWHRQEDGATEARRRALSDSYETLEREIEAIPQTYSTEDMTIAGAVVHVNWDGKLGVRRGVVRREHAAAFKARERGGAVKVDASGAVEVDHSSLDRVSGKVREDLGKVRRMALREALEADPVTARAVLEFQIVDSMMVRSGRAGCAIGRTRFLGLLPEFEADGLHGETDDPRFSSPAGGPLGLRRESYYASRGLDALNLGAWEGADGDEGAARFHAFMALEENERGALVAHAVASLVIGGTQLPGEDAFADELASDVLGVDFAASWRPDRAYLSRLKRPQLLRVARDAFGAEEADASAKLKKGELVERLVEFFEGDEQRLNEAQRKVRHEWLPPQVASGRLSTEAPSKIVKG